MQNQSNTSSKTKKAKSTRASNARPIGMIRPAYGEATAVANIIGCSKSLASYHIKRRNPAYLDVLYEVRRKAEREFSEMQEKFAALLPVL